METIAERMLARMGELNLTRADVGRIAGMSRAGVGLICNDRAREIGATTAIKLADALQCDVRWLVLGEEVNLNKEGK